MQGRETGDREDRNPKDPGSEDQHAEDPDDEDPAEVQNPAEDQHAEDPDGEVQDPDVCRARWTAVGTGVLLTVAGLAASAMRSSGSTTALIPLSYASGAVLCAGASALGAKGRTRRALWLMIVGVMVMAVGDQLD
ncbi:hypothetical protein N4G66_20455 [Streptomyces rhizosphaerihabitans]|nr:hypothetical protein [Streptomyces rhizosphaerihabitans]MCT9007217.1 hypothetical protein [Streptomyces rhizosphaerihabitans]